MASLTITFTVPETEDKCWTPDGVQCFYDAVLKQAHFKVGMMLAKAHAENNTLMVQHHQRQMDVITSVKVDGIELFN